MKNVTFDDARAKFEAVFDLARGGEMVVIARNHERVAVHSFPTSEEPDLAPPGYFENDYEPAEIDELNALAAQGPKSPIP